MLAFEVAGHIDKQGKLKINSDIPLKEGEVKIIIMYNDEKPEESQWLNAISKSAAFNFLNDPEEDIYSPTHGKPFHG